MFVQVIKGHTSDPAGLLGRMDSWQRDVKPGAIGYEGSTIGVAADGTFLALARFRDADAARQNADRPEQGAWWEETVKFFDAEPAFRESSDVRTLFDGGSNDAGFVQVMEGTAPDRAKAEAMETPELLEQLRAARPDLLGGYRLWFPDGSYLEAAYFTSEAAARAGEASAEFSESQSDFETAFGQPSFLDLPDPLLD